MTTATEERKEARITHDALAVVVRETIDAVLQAQHYSYSTGINLDSRITAIVKEKATALHVMMSAAIRAKDKHPAWPAMLAAADDPRRGILTSYQKDFYYHDREILEQAQPAQFAWAVYDMGSYLMIPGTGRDSNLDLTRAAHNSGTRTWFWWDGRTLAEISGDEAVTRIERAERALTRKEARTS